MSKIEFPRWIYKGKTEQKIVQTLEEYQTALAEGWRKGVIDESEIDDSEKLNKIGDDVKFIRKEVKKIAQGVDALQSNSEAPSMDAAQESEPNLIGTWAGAWVGTTQEPEESEPEEPRSYRAMLEGNAKKLNIKFGIKTSNSQLAAMIQRRG